MYNAKEHYKSCIIKESRKSVKQSEINTCQPRSFQNPKIVDIKSINTEHPKTSYKLSKTIRQAKKVGSNSSLYRDTEKKWKFLEWKKYNNNKTRTCF